jgi:hypothetical protein
MIYVFEFQCGTCGSKEVRYQVGAQPITPRCDACGFFMRTVIERKEAKR